ncbi:YadA-like family protein [uncultured Phascolarctobacterium sp.]|uniref:YadA-like family protein n=1 Tax=uncultured Phascolarctobacterium sp. TaxID=512296 RepID=UPI0025F620FE|nr:YadA-like family protein [uncultured Phascolarctobacterium sp.]
MTRKKSNVKALALAVTCAILAGGYSGLNPVYAAADTLYKEGNNVTTSSTPSVTGGGTNTEITELTVGGVTIGGTGEDAGQIIAKNIVGIKNASAGTLSDIHINGATFASNGAITASILKLDDGIHPINNVAEAIGNNKDNINTLQTKTTNISYNATTGTTVDGVVLKDKGITAADGKFTVKADGQTVFTGDPDDKGKTTIKNGETVVEGANGKVTINNGGIEIAQKAQDTGENYSIKLDSGYVEASGYVKAPKFYIDNDNKFEKNSLSVGEGTNSVKIGGGTITASKDVNVGGNLWVGDKFEVNTDGTKVKGNVTFNEGQNNQVKITDEGVVVGLGSTVIGSDGVYAGGHTETTAKAVLGADGSIKGAGDGVGNYKFSVDDTSGDTVVGGTLDVTGDTTLKGKLDVTGDTNLKGKLDVTGNATVGGTFGVTGAATLGSTLDVNGKATFGIAAGSQTVINGGDITADGKLTAKSATIGAVGITDTGIVSGVTELTTKDLKVTGLLNISGDIAAKNISGDSLTVNGAIKGASLEVTGAVNGATINGAMITTNSFNGATIGATTFNGVTLTTDGDVSGRNMTASGTIKGNEIIDSAGASMKAGTVTGTKITDGVGFTATGGNVTAKDINATTGTIAGVQFAANNVSGINNLTATGTIQGATLKVNDNNLLDNNGLKAEKAVIDNLTIDGASITSNNADGSVGVAGITVDKTGAITGVKAIDGVVVAGNTASGGLTIGSGATAVTIGGNSLALSSTGFNVDDDGDVTGKSFNVNGSNYLGSTGLTTDKAVIGGVNTLNDQGIDTSKNLHVGGQATFGNSTGIRTTINGGTITSTDGTDSTTIGPNKITTKTLEADTIILNDHMQDGAGNKIEIGADGHLNVAGNNFTIDTIGQLTNEYTGTDAAGRTTKTTLKTSVDGINANYTNSVNNNNNLLNINQDGVALGVTDSSNNLGMLSADADKATMGYGTENSIVVSADTIKSALGTDVTRVMTSSATDKSIVDAVGTDASRTLKADEIVDKVGSTTVTTKSGGTTFSDGTTNTLINGSAITSTNGAATGVLNGSNLTLTNGANSTALTAGGATFTKDGKTTTISGGTITTNHLITDKLTITGSGNADGTGSGTIAFGGNGTIKSNIKGEAGTADAGKETTFETKLDGVTTKVTDGTITTTNAVKASGNTNTVTNGVFTSSRSQTATEITDKVDNAKSTITKDSITDKVGTDAKNTTVTTTDNKFSVKGATDKGMEIDTDTGKTTFKGAVDTTVPTTETTINGNTITTGKLVTDKLVIKGNRSGDTSGDGGESGSIAFGGNGTIKSNIKGEAGTADAGKETTFETKLDGVTTKVTDGNTTTENKVTASSNTNTVKEVTGDNNSSFTQTATSIGGVVTNGTVKMKQELTAEGVKVTDELDNPTKKYTQITNKDVSITDPKNTGERIKLSDLGQLNNLDGELEARDEYQNNKTAVGAINAEAAIRREEVARLDNRIDDVNNRVDKVGAMAAAIASLKSIGYDPQAPSEFSIGLGQYKGETGVAMGFFHYPNKNFMINVSLSTAGGETMGGIGATWRFGHKSPQKLLDEQREAQAKKELAAAEKYQAAAKLAKEAQERAEYAAKLARQAQVSADNAKAAADATQAKHFQ